MSMVAIFAWGRDEIITLEEKGEPEIEEELAIQRLERLQHSFHRLAIYMDYAAVHWLHDYPRPDFEHRINPQLGDPYQSFLLRYGTALDMALFERLRNEKRSVPFDHLALLPYPDTTSPTLLATRRALGQFTLQEDPFSQVKQIIYLSTLQDYHLISAGPNRRNDLTDFSHGRDGRYFGERVGLEITDEELATHVESTWSQFDPGSYEVRRPLQVRNIDGIYDPTNGLLSDGDVAFHRRGGDNWMFSFPAWAPLNERNLIKRDLRELFKVEAILDK